MSDKATFKEGLEDVVASVSSICFIDGNAGVLAYRGYNIHDLATHSTFEEVCHLLWHGRLPTADELKATGAAIAAERAVPAEVLELMRKLPKDALAMDVLRTTTSALALWDKEANDKSQAANLRKCVRLTAQMATLVCAWHRIKSGKNPVDPDPSLSQAANFLYMLFGEKPEETAARAFDVALILHADHEFNASTFSARVTASTLSDMHSAITSAIGALKGPLHGGANMEVMAMLREIGPLENVEPFIKKALADKRKIPGFGHRVYRTEDPRATHLRRMSKELGQARNEMRWYDTCMKIEALVKAEKKLDPNVDFYSASVYHHLGIEDELFTPIFAVSRISGWTAHAYEQMTNNRIMRPRAEYTGAENATYVPLVERTATAAKT